MIIRLYFILLLPLLLALPCAAAELPGIPAFIDEMTAKHGFKRAELEQVFQRAQHQQAIIDLISTPAAIKPWLEYRAIFVNDKRISGGVQFWQRHAKALKLAEKQYGVPQEVIVAVIGVETQYGRNSGKFSVLDALTTLAFDYPRRADFFRSELENYLLLAREQEWELFKVQGSYAGAIGIPQFMPSSYRKHAVDFNNDGIIDLLNDPLDAIGSVANYLKQFGSPRSVWLSGEPVAVRARVGEVVPPGMRSNPKKSGVFRIKEMYSMATWTAVGVTPVTQLDGDKPALLLDFTVADGVEFWLAFNNFQVITLYNNSNFYAMSVYQLAEALRNARDIEAKNSSASTADAK